MARDGLRVNGEGTRARSHRSSTRPAAGRPFGYSDPMRLRALLFVTLAPFVSGCGGCCFPAHEPFRVKGELHEAELGELLKRYDRTDADYARLTCAELCELVYEVGRDWQLVDLGTCTHTIRPPGEVGPDEVVATVDCTGRGAEFICKGRRPLGHVERLEFAGDELGAYLAHCAHLEAASVAAFHELAEQLAGLGAPAELVARCRVAAADEERHAAVLGGFAAARGAEVPPPERRACAPSLAAIAAHNAVEGCVHEAWAAVGAAWQAIHARDPALRAAFAVIADEEADHAQLAWDLHTWLIGQLDDDARAAVLAGQRRAIEALPRVAATEVGPRELGLPDAGVRAAMAARFAAELARSHPRLV